MSSKPISRLPAEALDALGLSAGSAPALTQRRVTPLDTPLGKVWVKRQEPPAGPLRRAARAGLTKLIPVPILRPGGDNKGADTLILQAKQSETLRSRGMPVADVLYSDADCLILSDAGISLDPVAKALSAADAPHAIGDIDRNTLHAILLQMTETLGELHMRDMAHGRPKIRDFGWKRVGAPGDGRPAQGSVTLLDLEERPWTVMPMAAAQARDVFLWLMDLSSLPATEGIAPAAMHVLGRTMSDETRHELRFLTRLLSVAAPPVRLMARTPLKNREIMGSLAAYDVLRAGL